MNPPRARSIAPLVLLGAITLAPTSRAETCDDHPEGPPPLTNWDKTRWDLGLRGELPFEASAGVRAGAAHIYHPNFDLGLRGDYAYERGGRQTVTLSLEARVFWWFNYGGTGANVCGYKVRVLERFSGAPYVLLSAGSGTDVAPRLRLVGLGRVGIGWEVVLSRMAALFVEVGGAFGTMGGVFGSVGVRL